MKKASAAFLMLVLPLAFCFSQVPVHTESTIWSALAFNGHDYSATFSPETSDTLFLLAGVDNILSLRKTLVYWWPITSEWKTDADSLDIQYRGTLELRDGKGPARNLQMVPYTYFNVRGEYEMNWRVATGEAARRELQAYAAESDSYATLVEEYRKQKAVYDQMVQNISSRIGTLREQHKDYSSLLQELRTLSEPALPSPPQHYEVPPAALQEAFVLNLPRGRYTIRVVNPQGEVLEGSEKVLVVHNAFRTGGVGFEVIPGDKWTRAEESVNPSSVLYVNGSADVYLRPFFEDEFNDLAYEKTLNNAAPGNPNVAKWVRIQQVPHARVEIEEAGAPRSILSEQPFNVVQTEGSSLGYAIVPLDTQRANNAEPTLVAFHIPLAKGGRSLQIRALDANGVALQGSDRRIRVVGPLERPALYIAFALLPLLVMAIVLWLRARSDDTQTDKEA
jgi:hypothetical protein